VTNVVCKDVNQELQASKMSAGDSSPAYSNEQENNEFPHSQSKSLRSVMGTIREMKDACFGSRPMKVKRGEWQEQDLRHFQKKKKKYNDLKMVQLD